ncbi:noncanonical pyrimidine nucleotidase, YjjG family [Mucilaginibacter pallidiroseus]|uniref:Noncanonical pyrimidine nucleotidase, YjjG family n=1 Tax=Mucilaginibacter pallidiroseus TaxID=2599295 RepID=A0A563UGD2_9SPHI|nr:YjjG family noncanonical pyrimidine nucleotidase [Mucilaginibacter pallidiroseus]TWR30407.1 noncanonical pyrimidine nucleotidase, YjjG family [Mucilaginibacter pallidiroseus]
MKSYKHIFFDLDHTIWDFDKNAEETLNELYCTYNLGDIGIVSCADFIESYTRNNHQLWADYHLGKISKETLRGTRFRKTFLEMGVLPDLVPDAFEDDYVRLGPYKTNLFPHAHETLSYLQGKYTLHLISNGFKESVETKVSNTGIDRYFDQIIISEIVGVNKPDPAIFEYAVNAANAKADESVMIGDSIEADIRGALGYGMDAIYFNPIGLEKPADVPKQIAHLKELTLIL